MWFRGLAVNLALSRLPALAAVVRGAGMGLLGREILCWQGGAGSSCRFSSGGIVRGGELGAGVWVASRAGVAVFGASNFPLAFSVGGGDSASALAAGCPVVCKGHPAHPGTSEMVARAAQAAVEACGFPAGTFSLIQGAGIEVGVALVRHPAIKAVGFTGSLRGGRALFDEAARRPEPIPVYAEMGSTNPVFILPGALKERGDKIAEGLAGSVTMGVGQVCTKPGLVFVPASSQAFLDYAAPLLEAA